MQQTFLTPASDQPAKRRLLGPRRLLLLTTGGLGFARLGMQFWTGDPLGDLYLAIPGAILFVLFLPTYLGRVRAAGASATGRFALGLLFGLALDSAIHGALGTYDPHWQTGLGSLILVVLLVLIQYEIRLPFSNMILPPVAGLIVGLCTIGATLALPRQREIRGTEWRSALIAVILLVLPVVKQVTWRTPAPVAGNGYPVRVMTFNLHNGFDMAGFLGMEALAEVIEAEQPDIVALQEVSHGWVISGSLDMLTWLSRRLDMPAVFGPTADPIWGNAILSRYPLLEYQNQDLPPRDLPILRGFLWSRIDIGDDRTLKVIATHFHQVREEHAIRVQQTRAILSFWDGAGALALMGDLNARPGNPEIEMLRDAGLSDVLDLAGIDPGYTSPADDPIQRIDYVWVTPDLTVDDVIITEGTASDHRGVAATVSQQ